MHLGRNFKLKKTKYGVELQKRTEGRNPKTEETTIKWTSTYHGNLYEALHRALDLSIDPSKDFGYILEDIADLMCTIEDNKKQLKAEFRTEVRIER
jgi:hypothetical protein